MTESASPRSLLLHDVVAELRSAGCVFAEEEAALLIETTPETAELASMIERRRAGTPLEVILGWAQFCGRRIAVDPGVFVPRRRSELLAHRAADLARADAVVVDLCCGTGALGAAVAAKCPGVQLYAADVDPAAVQCARRNLQPFGARVYQGDLLDALPAALQGRIDLLIVNAPYVPTAEIALMPPEARDHEPLVALDGGSDGTDVQARVIAAAPQWLTPCGHLLMETSAAQAHLTVRASTAGGLLPQVARSEELGSTVVIGTKPGEPVEP